MPPNETANPFAVYIHWPFCVSKCPYCDFSSTATPPDDEDALVRALCMEMEWYADRTKERRVTSVFFGGGTPSLLKPASVGAILRKVSSLWAMDSSVEITLETNPVTAEIDRLEDFRAAGVNRLSLGVQSFSDDTLRFLGRAHDREQAQRALRLARGLFPRFSFDLMYGFAGQTEQAWKTELEQAIDYGAKHLSLYQLTIEPHTAFHLRQMRGEKLVSDEETASALYDLTGDFLSAHGLPLYEISNHAAPGEESRHNLTYWTYGDYIGLGPAAHGRLAIGGERRAIENHKAPKQWVQQIQTHGHGAVKREILLVEQACQEAAIMGLRLASGIDERIWRARFDQELTETFFPERWSTLVLEGLVKKEGPYWRVTDQGRKTLNSVLNFLLI